MLSTPAPGNRDYPIFATPWRCWLRGILRSPESPIARQSFASLTEASECDNLYLEHRLALELRELGLMERVCTHLSYHVYRHIYPHFA